MSEKIQSVRIVEAMARAICEAKGYEPDAPVREYEHLVQWQCFREIAQAALTVAYPMIREKLARVALRFETKDWASYDPLTIATAIRTTELPLAEKERE